MPALTRRRSTDAREECWHIYYGDVRVGTIAIRSGKPHDEDPWEWHCGFYPAANRNRRTFDEARADSSALGRSFFVEPGRCRFSGMAR